MAEAVLCVIPARFGATRFPGKPLATLWGRPLIQHVWESARRVDGIDRLVIATDDDRIAEAARAFGATVAMTSPDCASGTDRVAEVARANPDFGVIVNLQGDEPELDTAAVSTMVRGLLEDRGLEMATLAHAEEGEAFLTAPDVVKVWVDEAGFALYFSRGVDAGRPMESPSLRHVGVYGFRRDLLLRFAGWPQGVLEKSERLEQLRALERGVRIRVFMCERPSTGVDTPEQLAALETRGPRL